MEIKTKNARGLLLVLFLGQLVAFSLAAGNFTSSLVANLGTYSSPQPKLQNQTYIYHFRWQMSISVGTAHVWHYSSLNTIDYQLIKQEIRYDITPVCLCRS
jgi:hypothetical protein